VATVTGGGGGLRRNKQACNHRFFPLRLNSIVDLRTKNMGFKKKKSISVFTEVLTSCAVTSEVDCQRCSSQAKDRGYVI
jgi:hypothetical protein